MIRNTAREQEADNQDGSEYEAPAELHLPEIPPAFAGLLEFFFLAGQVNKSGMGISPLTWQELKAFREETEADICIWEREILKEMSEAYCNEYAHASAPDRNSPYKKDDGLDEVNEVIKARKIMSGLSGFKRRKG